MKILLIDAGMEKVKFQKEYLVKASNKIIYQCLTTPSGLAEWFADDVNIRGEVFTFIWEGSEEQARLVSKRKDELVRFRWLQDEEDGEDTYFELRIREDDLTGEIALLVTDYTDEDEIEDAELLWDSNIDKLKHILGS